MKWRINGNENFEKNFYENKKIPIKGIKNDYSKE